MLLPVVGPVKTHDAGRDGNTGSGGPITISSSTLAEHQIAAAARYKFIRSCQFDEAVLLAATEQHWHSIRSIESVTLSVACGITNMVFGDARPADGSRTAAERRFA